ncbi:MAG: Baseplate wedge protein gp25 [Bacteroidota bacterium]|jgi:phage baseplate assembly protein W
MAIELGKVNVTDLSQNDYKVLGIGINKSSNSNGVFAVNYTTLTQAKDNLTNLIMTQKGERVHQPDFGCDIWKVLFEQIVDGDIDYKVESVILDAVSKWLPYITINDIILDYNDEYKDSNKIGVEINFSLTSNPNLKESVTINVN